MYVEKLLPQARDKLVTIVDGASLVEAAKLLRPGTDLVIVSDREGRLVGVVTRTDIVNQLSFCDGMSCVVDIPLAITRDVVSCRPTDKLEDVWKRIKETGVKNIPVTDQSLRPIGLINAGDVFRSLLDETQYEEAMLRDYIMGVGYR